MEKRLYFIFFIILFQVISLTIAATYMDNPDERKREKGSFLDYSLEPLIFLAFSKLIKLFSKNYKLRRNKHIRYK